ncbi:MAG: histidine phosphatase family protein [Acidobacteria bacterium]|nr:histidine phosphatase family protein [Acidobacteriota bacterium]
MKTLLLLRHARPTQSSPTGRDFGRPLADEGRADALLVGQFLRRRKLTPDTIVCSPAARARETADLVIEAAQLDAPLLFHESIYEASTEQLIEVVSEVEDSADVVLMVGHNPGLQSLLERLTGEGAAMTPATLARIDLDIDAWNELRRGAQEEEEEEEEEGRLVFAFPPQALAGH